MIKSVKADLFNQLLARFGVFTVAALALAKPAALATSWGSASGAARSLALGMLTLSHVGVSYFAFKELPAGVAMSLFYTYPVLNVVAGSLFFQERIHPEQMALLVIAFVGVLLVAGWPWPRDPEAPPVNWKGISSALAAAATETAMYFAVRTAAAADPYLSLLELYPGALVGLAAYAAASPVEAKVDNRAFVWGPMILFNLLIGFVGYGLRFYAIPKLSTGVFSILSFVGVVAAFVWGWLFAQEVPTVKTLIGAGLISFASGMAGRH